MTPLWATLHDGADAAEDLAAALGVPLEKQDPAVLSTPGFESAVRSLLRAIARVTVGADKAAIKRLAQGLDQNWSLLSEAKRTAVIASAARSLLGVPKIVIGPVQKSIVTSMTNMVRIAKRDTGIVHRLAINPTFNVRDQNIIDAAAKSQGNYITDRYANRVASIEQRARDIVSNGLEKGLGRVDIGAELRASLVAPALRTSEAYWETIASIHIGRARSLGQMSGYSDAGIEEFEFEAVLDSETTDQCRFLNGKRFSVAKALGQFEEVEKSDDPKGVENIQPWLRSGKTKDGQQILFIDTDKGRKVIADVHESGVGTEDKIGKYSSKHDDAGLQKLGLCCPPLHARCRSTTTPV